MLTLLMLGALGLGGWYACRWVKSSDNGWAEIARVIIWGEERPR